MGKVEIYKIIPNGWNLEKSYLIAEKKSYKTSYNKLIEYFEVIKRCSLVGYEKKLVLSDSLKGVHYNKKELFGIYKYKCEDTEQDIICNSCEDCDFGFEINQNFY